MTRLTATEVARSFSAVINRVAEGEEIEITRNGRTVAVLKPPHRKKTFVSTDELRELFASLPRADDEFVRDLEQLRRSAGPPDR